MTYDLEKLKEQLILHEGVKEYAYQDHLGYWTIGIGHLIDARKGGKISQDTIAHIFKEDVTETVTALDKRIPWWKTLNEVRQRVLIDMCFNLGIDGLLEFKNTLTHIERGEYREASQAMLQSLWAKQVGDRAIRLARMMEAG